MTTGVSEPNRSTSPLWLTHAAIMTTRLDDSIAFYRDILELQLRIVEDDPIREGRRRALLSDSEGRDIIEIIEMTEMAHPSIPGRGGIHHIGFTLPPREWHSLRSRMDARGYAYQEIGKRLFVRDADGLILEIEASSPSARRTTVAEGTTSATEIAATDTSASAESTATEGAARGGSAS